MTDRQQLVDQLILEEGLRLRPYVDTVGKITIGVGRNLTDKGLSHSEAMDLLNHDIDEAVTDLAAFPWFVTLDAVRQRAITDLRFNTGPKGFGAFIHLIAAMATHDYVEAADQLVKSAWYHQVQPTRSARLQHQLATGSDT